MINLIQPGKKKLAKRQISRFCNQLKMLLSSGVPLLEALRIVKGMSQFSKIDNIIQQVEQGISLGEALADYFPSMVASSVQSAETAGNLEEVLGRLAKYYEDRAETEEKVKSALMYPCFVILLCLACLIVLLVFILPGFKSLFSDLDADLPLFTQIIINLGDIFSRTWHMQIFSFSVLGILLKRYRRTSRGALALDKFILRIKFLSREYVIQGFRTLGSLLEGGIPIVQALSTTAGSSKNRAFQKIILEIKTAIEHGEKLSDILNRYAIFPREAVQMISVGENTGSLAEMLLNISNIYEKEREILIKRFTSMLEPALTLIVGLVVGIIVIAVFLPMVNMISNLQ